MKMVVTGAGGMLGADVVASARATPGHEVVALGRDDLDVTDPARGRAAIVRERPAR